MCRHMAYLGWELSLAQLLVEPRHSLLEQTWAPRDMRGGGTVNTDGFGVGWYPPDQDQPVRYRSAFPMYTDQSFIDLAAATRSGAVLAAVRSATIGMPLGSQACQPLTDGQWLFSHNGKVDGWPAAMAGPAKRLDVVDLLTMDALSDSAVVWALLRQRLTESDPVTAVRTVLAEVLAAAPESRMNLLLTDGAVIIATTWTHSLWVWHGLSSVIVASEPFGAEPGWEEVPDRHLLIADTSGSRQAELDDDERGDHDRA